MITDLTPWRGARSRWRLFPAGSLLSLLGLLILGITALIRGQHHWAGLLPFIGMLIGIAGDQSGSIVTGVTRAVTGGCLWSEARDTAAVLA